jgi:GntR family transcriptional regulator
MLSTLRIDPTDPRPIWRQIEETVRHLVASQALPAGAGVPSVRDLAKELQVNPATVSKAYQRLTDAGVLVVRRGDGERRSRLTAGALRYASLAATLGSGETESVATLRKAWSSLSTLTGAEE